MHRSETAGGTPAVPGRHRGGHSTCAWRATPPRSLHPIISSACIMAMIASEFLNQKPELVWRNRHMTRFAASALLATLLFIGTSLYGQAGYTFNYSDPGFSSDGKLIVFAVLVYNFDQSGSALRSELRSINANGTNPRTLRTVTMGAISKPRFSPDGKKIVFVHESGGPYEIWLMNADGSGAEAVVANKSYNDNPMFDGDGNVVYVRDSKQVI